MFNNDILQTFNPENYNPEDLMVPEYPGTLKGPYPEDDPDFFKIWIQSNSSPIMDKISEILKGKGSTELEDEYPEKLPNDPSNPITLDMKNVFVDS